MKPSETRQQVLDLAMPTVRLAVATVNAWVGSIIALHAASGFCDEVDQQHPSPQSAVANILCRALFVS